MSFFGKVSFKYSQINVDEKKNVGKKWNKIKESEERKGKV